MTEIDTFSLYICHFYCNIWPVSDFTCKQHPVHSVTAEEQLSTLVVEEVFAYVEISPCSDVKNFLGDFKEKTLSVLFEVVVGKQKHISADWCAREPGYLNACS